METQLFVKVVIANLSDLRTATIVTLSCSKNPSGVMTVGEIKAIILKEENENDFAEIGRTYQIECEKNYDRVYIFELVEYDVLNREVYVNYLGTSK